MVHLHSAEPLMDCNRTGQCNAGCLITSQHHSCDLYYIWPTSDLLKYVSDRHTPWPGGHPA